MRNLILLLLFVNITCYTQNNFSKQTDEIKVFEEEYKIVTSEIQVSENEIYRMLEASIVYAEHSKEQLVFYVHISEQEKGFKASFSQAENFDFFPTNKQNLIGYIEYKKVYFFIFSNQKTSFFIPSNKTNEFIIKNSFSCIPKPSKNYIFHEGKTYQVEYLFGKEYKEPLRVWVNGIDY